MMQPSSYIAPYSFVAVLFRHCYAMLPHFFIPVPLCEILLEIHWLTVTVWD